MNLVIPPPRPSVCNFGGYTCAFAYEEGVWRFITWRNDNYYKNIQPPAFASVTPYIPMPAVPSSRTVTSLASRALVIVENKLNASVY